MTPQPLHVLVSFAHLNQMKPDKLEHHLAQILRPDWNIMLDSGAFSNYTLGKQVVSFDEYTSFLKRHQGSFWHCIAYDVIGDMRKSEDNVKRMQDMGLNPVPVFQRGGTRDQLHHMMEAHDVIAIGGISRRSRAREEQDYLRQVMRIVKDHKVHLLGLGWTAAKQYRPYSLDSTTPFETSRFGRVALWDHKGWVRLSKDRTSRSGNGYVRPNLRHSHILQSYGLTWEDLAKREAYKDAGIASLATVRSWIRHASLLNRNRVRYVFALLWNRHALTNMKTAWAKERPAWGWI